MSICIYTHYKYQQLTLLQCDLICWKQYTNYKYTQKFRSLMTEHGNRTQVICTWLKHREIFTINSSLALSDKKVIGSLKMISYLVKRFS